MVKTIRHSKDKTGTLESSGEDYKHHVCSGRIDSETVSKWIDDFEKEKDVYLQSSEWFYRISTNTNIFRL